jgi:hypothetical protein
MNSRSSRSHRSFPGGAYGAGLSSSYGSGLGTSTSAGYSSFSSGYSPGYTSYSGYLTGASRPGYSTAPSLSPGYNNTGGKYSGGGAYTAASLLPPTATSSSSSYTSKRYTGAKTDSDLLANGLGSAGGNPSSWRSKSTDPALTNGYRERSLSRDPSTSYSYDPPGDGYAASASRASAARDHYHHLGRAERSPSFVSSREFRAGSFSGGGAADSGITDSSLLMSPPRVRKPAVTSTDYLYRSTPPLAPPAYDSASRFSNATASLYRPSLSRSNSFHDLREGLTAGFSSPTTPKAR